MEKRRPVRVDKKKSLDKETLETNLHYASSTCIRHQRAGKVKSWGQIQISKSGNYKHLPFIIPKMRLLETNSKHRAVSLSYPNICWKGNWVKVLHQRTLIKSCEMCAKAALWRDQHGQTRQAQAASIFFHLRWCLIIFLQLLLSIYPISFQPWIGVGEDPIWGNGFQSLQRLSGPSFWTLNKGSRVLLM